MFINIIPSAVLKTFFVWLCLPVLMDIFLNQEHHIRYTSTLCLIAYLSCTGVNRLITTFINLAYVYAFRIFAFSGTPTNFAFWTSRRRCVVIIKKISSSFFGVSSFADCGWPPNIPRFSFPVVWPLMSKGENPLHRPQKIAAQLEGFFISWIDPTYKMHLMITEQIWTR